MISIQSNPGATQIIAIQSTDGYGSLADGYQAPSVDFIIMPSGSQAAGYPQVMTKISTGIYKHSFIITNAASSLGTYIVSCSWPKSDTSYFQNELFLINVIAPFGNSTIYPG